MIFNHAVAVGKSRCRYRLARRKHLGQGSGHSKDLLTVWTPESQLQYSSGLVCLGLESREVVRLS